MGETKHRVPVPRKSPPGVSCETSWARRTYVEGAFGNLKNHHTGNIKRGFMTAHGIPLVSLALTAAVVAHNMRELESWCRAARKHDPKNPLLALYESHPLHQESEHIYGSRDAHQGRAGPA